MQTAMSLSWRNCAQANNYDMTLKIVSGAFHRAYDEQFSRTHARTQARYDITDEQPKDMRS